MNPGEVMDRLDGKARELDELSKGLDESEKALESLQAEYDAFIDDYVCTLWDMHVHESEKWPGEDVRMKLARRAMDAQLRAQHDMAAFNRRRIEARIRDLKAEIDAERSLLSALKLEMEATRA